MYPSWLRLKLAQCLHWKFIASEFSIVNILKFPVWIEHVVIFELGNLYSNQTTKQRQNENTQFNIALSKDYLKRQYKKWTLNMQSFGTAPKKWSTFAFGVDFDQLNFCEPKIWEKWTLSLFA